MRLKYSFIQFDPTFTTEINKEINVPTPEAAFGTAVKENPSIIYSNISWHNS